MAYRMQAAIIYQQQSIRDRVLDKQQPLSNPIKNHVSHIRANSPDSIQIMPTSIKMLVLSQIHVIQIERQRRRKLNL